MSVDFTVLESLEGALSRERKHLQRKGKKLLRVYYKGSNLLWVNHILRGEQRNEREEDEVGKKMDKNYKLRDLVISMVYKWYEVRNY